MTDASTQAVRDNEEAEAAKARQNFRIAFRERTKNTFDSPSPPNYGTHEEAVAAGTLSLQNSGFDAFEVWERKAVFEIQPQVVQVR